MRRLGSFIEVDPTLWLFLNPCMNYLGHNIWSVHYTDQHGKRHSEMFNDEASANRLLRHIREKGIFAHP